MISAGDVGDHPAPSGAVATDRPVETWQPVDLLGPPRAAHDLEFTAFVQAHQGELLRTAWLLLGDAHRAEELTQQALVRTYAAWPRARERDPVAYARRVLVNLRTDTWRRRRREVLVPTELVPEDRESPPAQDVAARLADRDFVVRALGTLTYRQRRILVLRHLVGLPEAQVAEDLGISIGTVKSTTARALAQLRTTFTLDGSAVPPAPIRSDR